MSKQHTLTVERFIGRKSTRDEFEWDFHPSMSVENEREETVLYVYMSTGNGYCYHVLVGKADVAHGGYERMADAYLDGMEALRKVPAYRAAPIIAETVRN